MKMNRVFEFMGISTRGKLPRVLLGLAFIFCGMFLVHGYAGLILANIGGVPLTYGLFDW
jgi:hypothetical protein